MSSRLLALFPVVLLAACTGSEATDTGADPEEQEEAEPTLLHTIGDDGTYYTWDLTSWEMLLDIGGSRDEDTLEWVPGVTVGLGSMYGEGDAGTYDFDATNDTGFADFAASATDGTADTIQVVANFSDGGSVGNHEDAPLAGKTLKTVRLNLHSVEIDGDQYAYTYNFEFWGM